MRINIIVHSFYIISICCFCLLNNVNGNNEALAEASNPGKAGTRAAAILRRGINARSKPTTSTTTTQAPLNSEDLNYPEDGNFNEESQQESENQDEQSGSSTTTEAPKNKVRGGLRPFRSNEDLLAALKKRRQQTSSKKYTKPAEPIAAESSEPENTPSSISQGRKKVHSSFSHNSENKSTSSRKRTNYSKATTEAAPTSETPKEPKPSRKYTSLRNKPAPLPASLQDFQSSESKQETVQVKKPRGYSNRSGSRFQA